MRRTGPSPTVRADVLTRDGSCVICGTSRAPLIVHHRLPRGRGGDNRHSNLILLCDFGGCHDTLVESYRADSILKGWLVSTGYDPAEVPLLWHGVRVLLGDDGTVRDVA